MTVSRCARSNRPVLAFGLLYAAACSQYTPPATTTTSDPCRPIELIPTRQRAIEYQDTDRHRELIPNCGIDEMGVVTMTYTPLDCANGAAWWAGCAFAGNLDLADFDPAQGPGQGVIAIRLCVKNFVPSALNLRYGSAEFSASGHTKWMPVITAQESFTGDGCRVVYLSPEDACYAAGRCGRQSGCYLDDRMPSPVEQCDSFARSEISIVNEFCVPPRATATQPTVVTIEQVTLFPQSCRCDDTSTCAAPRVCRRDGWPTSARCGLDGGDCPGVCAP